MSIHEAVLAARNRLNMSHTSVRKLRVDPDRLHSGTLRKENTWKIVAHLIAEFAKADQITTKSGA